MKKNYVSPKAGLLVLSSLDVIAASNLDKLTVMDGPGEIGKGDYILIN